MRGGILQSEKVKIDFYSRGGPDYMPRKAHREDACYDVFYCPAFDTEEAVFIPAGQSMVIPTGLRAIIPEGWKISIYSKSGLSSKQIVVGNSPGTVDAGYTNEIGVIIHNHSDGMWHFNKGEKIAQIAPEKVYNFDIGVIPTLDDYKSLTESSTRGEGGFGSTGK
jgi:dUTP pyrophosphatase